MDQIYQLQRQIQDLRQEVNSISQVASQLQRSEANNAAQLQQLHQHENMASQQLNAIQQICNRLNQDVNAINNVAQQISSQARPMTTGQFGTGIYNQYGTVQPATFGTGMTTGAYGPVQYGTFGAQMPPNRMDQFQRNQYVSSMAANRYGAGLNAPDYVSNQHISNLANQGMLGAQPNFAASNYGAGSMSTGNIAVTPAHPVQTTPFGTTGFAGSHYMPATSQSSSAAQPASGIFSHTAPAMSAQNIGRYSNF